MAAFKKKATIIGIGPRKKGVGKSGDPYDFCEISISLPRKNWEGEYPVCGRISGETLDDLPLIPGVVCTALLYMENYQYQLIDILGVEG